MDQFLLELTVYLTAAVLAVPIAKRLGLSSVLGFLLAGALIGPAGFGFIKRVDTVLNFAEFGIALLLFLVGLELNPKRLWELRRYLLGMGLLQVVLTILVIGCIAKLCGLSLTFAFVVGMGFAMSSTAIGIQALAEKKWLGMPAGQISFSVLLLQDLAVIPLMLLLSLLAPASLHTQHFSWWPIAKLILIVIGFVAISRYVLRYVLRFIANTHLHEIFISFALLLVIGSALLMESVGLSMAFGTFLAGVLLADSEYRHQLELDIEPFKGLLLGLFFIAVGMSVKLQLFLQKPLEVIGIALAVVAIKFILLLGLGYVFKETKRDRQIFAIALSQIGEFAFVLFNLAFNQQIISSPQLNLLNAIVAVSMLTTPLLILIYDKMFLPKLNVKPARSADEIHEQNPIILAGFGRMGSVLGRFFRGLGIGVTIIENDADQIELVRKYGYKAYYGDISQLNLLHAAGAAHAKLLILAINDTKTTIETAKMALQEFKHLKLLVRARNRSDAYELVELKLPFVRETFGSALTMAEIALNDLGYGAYEAHRLIQQFKKHDEKLLKRVAKVHRDQNQLISIAQLGRIELENLLQKEKNVRTTTESSGWD